MQKRRDALVGERILAENFTYYTRSCRVRRLNSGSFAAVSPLMAGTSLIWCDIRIESAKTVLCGTMGGNLQGRRDHRTSFPRHTRHHGHNAGRGGLHTPGDRVHHRPYAAARAREIRDKYLARTSRLADSAIAKFENIIETDFAKWGDQSATKSWRARQDEGGHRYIIALPIDL